MVKMLRFAILSTLISLSIPSLSMASPVDADQVWGYSFLFNFLGCLPSAFAIIICIWAKLTIADKLITNLMAFASGVSAASFLPETCRQRRIN
jgi:hypothetical protein